MNLPYCVSEGPGKSNLFTLFIGVLISQAYVPQTTVLDPLEEATLLSENVSEQASGLTPTSPAEQLPKSEAQATSCGHRNL